MLNKPVPLPMPCAPVCNCLSILLLTAFTSISLIQPAFINSLPVFFSSSEVSSGHQDLKKIFPPMLYTPYFSVFRWISLLAERKQATSRTFLWLPFPCPFCWDWNDQLCAPGSAQQNQTHSRRLILHFPHCVLAYQTTEPIWWLCLQPGNNWVW